MLEEEILNYIEKYGRMPRRNIRRKGQFVSITQMNEEEKNEYKLRLKWKNSKFFEAFVKFKSGKKDDVPEEFIEFFEEIKRKDVITPARDNLNDYLNYIEEHKKNPRAYIVRNGKRLLVGDMTEEERDEINLRIRWKNSEYKKIYDKYRGMNLSEIPEEYRDWVIRINKILGKKRKTVDEFIEFVEDYGRAPRTAIHKDGKLGSIYDLSKEEIDERNLAQRWSHCPEKKILDEFKGVELKLVPGKYRKIIEKLRSLGFGIEIRPIIDEYIEYVEKHNAFPRLTIYKVDETEDDLTEEESEEKRIATKWKKSKARKEYDLFCKESSLSFRDEEKYRMLRTLGKKVEQKKISKINSDFLDYINYIEKHKKEPKALFRDGAKILSFDELSESEKEEVLVRKAWMKSDAKKMYFMWINLDIEEIPEEYRESVKKLRDVAEENNIVLGKRKNAAEELLEYIEQYDEVPRVSITRNGKNTKVADLTQKEREEIRIAKRWAASEEKKILLAYRDIDIELVPLAYREMIKSLREFGLDQSTRKTKVNRLKLLKQERDSALQQNIKAKKFEEEVSSKLEMFERKSVDEK